MVAPVPRCYKQNVTRAYIVFLKETLRLCYMDDFLMFSSDLEKQSDWNGLCALKLGAERRIWSGIRRYAVSHTTMLIAGRRLFSDRHGTPAVG